MPFNEPKHILITRTDSIGDVVLTLPLAGALRKRFPGCRISFLGRTYTQSVISSCAHVDEFLNWDLICENPTPQRWTSIDWAIHALPEPRVMELCMKAGIPRRIATAGRAASWNFATHRIWFSRKSSDLHESQLNFRLLRPLGFGRIPELSEIETLYGIAPQAELPAEVARMVNDSRTKVILHPLSKGSAVNWGLASFAELTRLLPSDRFVVFITGTEAEGQIIKPHFDWSASHVHDLTGMLTLAELISLISSCDSLVAASTGPLHLSAALGKKAIGLFTPKRPMHPGRWGPAGPLSEVCVAQTHPADGAFLDISPLFVAKRLLVFSEERE